MLWLGNTRMCTLCSAAATQFANVLTPTPAHKRAMCVHVLHVAGCGRRYIDTSAYLPAYYPPQLQHFMNSYGRKKVLFGSNYPTLRPEMCSAGVADMELAPKTAAAFLRDNAIRVFKLPLQPAAQSANKSKL